MLTDYFVIEVDGIAIVGQSFLPDADAGFPAVCLCHGVPSGSPPEPGDGGYPALAETFCDEGYPVYFFNFRGAGDSGGNFDMPGWTRDLRAVVTYITGQEGNLERPLYLVGFSGGAAAAVYVTATDARVAGLAAGACPADFSLFSRRGDARAIVANYRQAGIIRDNDFPPSAQEWLDSFLPLTPEKHVAKIAPRPLLLVHGSLDDTVPVEHAQRLYAAAEEPKELKIIDGFGHRLRREPAVIEAVLDWLERQRQMKF